MQLALRLGRSLDELLHTVSSEELTMWRAFDLREPIGDWRHDLAAGVVASTLANVHRGKNVEAFAPRDFMPLTPQKKLTLAQRLRQALLGAGRAKEAKDGVSR